MRMIEAMLQLEPDVWTRWCELAPKLFPKSEAHDFLMLLEFYHIVFERWAADGDPIARDMVQAGGIMLQALVKAGTAGRITGYYLREDGVRAELTPSHWRAVAAPAHRLWRHEVIDLVSDRLVIAGRDGHQTVLLLGVDIMLSDEGKGSKPTSVELSAPQRRDDLVFAIWKKANFPSWTAKEAFKAARDLTKAKTDLKILGVDRTEQYASWRRIKQRRAALGL